MSEAKNKCLICGILVPDYEPEFCCSGMDCGCQGHPIDPCVCSQECYDTLIKGIGKPVEQRREDHIAYLRAELEKAREEIRLLQGSVDFGVKCNDDLQKQLADSEHSRKELVEGLKRIAKWHGEFPPTERFWDQFEKEPMSYSAAFGSNGERDYMRQVAAEALANAERKGMK